MMVVELQMKSYSTDLFILYGPGRQAPSGRILDTQKIQEFNDFLRTTTKGLRTPKGDFEGISRCRKEDRSPIPVITQRHEGEKTYFYLQQLPATAGAIAVDTTVGEMGWLGWGGLHYYYYSLLLLLTSCSSSSSC